LIYQYQLCNFKNGDVKKNGSREIMKIIIDGYNLIRQSESLRRFERYSLEEGRRELIRRLSLFKRLRGHTVIVVFDGWISGSAREERHNEGGITIIYSKRGEKADEVIKRLAMKGGSAITVVTSDRSIADFIGRRGNVTIASPEFEDRISLAETDKSFSARMESGEEMSDRNETSRKKKGPSRRLPKKQRRAAARLRKL
jgi:predicted RNA-binding protein with PIN domain